MLDIQEIEAELSKAKAFFRDAGVQEEVFECIAQYSLEYEVIICAYRCCSSIEVDSSQYLDILSNYMSDWDI